MVGGCDGVVEEEGEVDVLHAVGELGEVVVLGVVEAVCEGEDELGVEELVVVVEEGEEQADLLGLGGEVGLHHGGDGAEVGLAVVCGEGVRYKS